jgi:aspartate carbamoyltransferase catalytic subunit
MGAEIYVCGPPTLLPPHSDAMGVTTVYRPEEILDQVDVVMALRVQLERQNKMQLPSINEYSKFWGLTLERMKRMKKDAIILHPGPINRGVELDPEVADSPSSVILDQVTNGVIVRMAVLMHVMETEKAKEWFMNRKVTP